LIGFRYSSTPTVLARFNDMVLPIGLSVDLTDCGEVDSVGSLTI